MSVLVDATATKEDTSTASTSWSHTVGTLVDGALYVGVNVRTNGVVSITSVAIGASNFTLVDNIGRVETTPFRIGSAIYRLLDPPSGSQTITVTFSANVEQVEAYSISVYQVEQSASEGDIDKTSGTTSPASLVLDSSSGDLLIDCLGCHKPIVTGVTITVGADQTTILNDDIGVAGAGLRGGGSYEAGTGSNTMSWTFSVNTTFTYVSCVIRAKRPRLLALLGVGL